MSSSLVLLSHGSRHPDAHPAIVDLADATADLLGGDAEQVRVAHLELNPEFTMTRAVADLDAAIVVPLLFAGGFHARHDVPQQLIDATAATGAQLTLAEALGAGEDIADILAHRVHTDAPAGSHVVLYAVGSSLPSAQHAIATLGKSVARKTGHSVEFISGTNMTRSVSDAQQEHGHIHLLPLFVAPGLVLDWALDVLNPRSTVSAPLAADLAGVVAARYRAAVLA